MRWKKDVLLHTEGEYSLVNGDRCKLILDEDTYIMLAVQKGITDDHKLIKMIMREENVDEILAELRLSGVIIEYSEFLEELGDYMVIEP